MRCKHGVCVTACPDLLQQYMDESTQLISLRSRVTQLTDKLESLTVSLVNVTNNLNSCYETP